VLKILQELDVVNKYLNNTSIIIQMKIIIDNRESSLIKLIESSLSNSNLSHLTCQVEQLDIGDIKIVSDNNKTQLIFERKLISDLASSISDGRYNEQSFRLDKCGLHNHNIFYLIEGDLKNFKPYKRSRISKDALYSSLFTLSYYKGFSVYRTDNCYESANLLIKIADKLHREMKSGKRLPYYNLDTDSDNTSVSSNNNDYVDTIKTQKKNFITKDNITQIMLMQIPGVSANFANIITNEFKTMIDVICALQEDIHCLNHLTYKTSTGKVRKISKTCIENIKTYVLQETE